MKTVVLLCLTGCLLLVGQVIADPYLVLKVPQGGETYSQAQLWSDHTNDALFETGNYNLDNPWVALDFGAVKYTTLGPDAIGAWTAYVWAGYHMVANTPYELVVEAYGASDLTCVNYDGTPVFQATLQSGEIRTWTLLATPATASQWRTRGYKVTVTPIPEPTTWLVLVSGLVGFAGVLRRRVR